MYSIDIIVGTMYRRRSKKRELVMRIVSYVAMVLSILAIVAVVIFLLLGYRLDTDNGRIEQGALLQFETIPSGATVTIDGKELGAKTSTKSSVLAGVHTIVIQKQGYETWRKTLNIKAGTLTWLDYIRLVPLTRSVESVASYDKLYMSVSSPDDKTMIVQRESSVPTFDVVDLRSDDVKSSTITIPKTSYSEADTAGVAHTFALDSWDEGGRYVLVRHTYADKSEWLVMDTRDVTNTKNITTLLDVDISHVVFSGTSGNVLFALTGGDIRKLDLSAGTISRSLVSNVSSFSLFETNVITYTGTDTTDPSKKVVGLYRDGDNAPHVLRSVDAGTSVLIKTTHYFNHDYVAIATNDQIDILYGSYPSNADDTSSLATLTSYVSSKNVESMSFSPNGDYLVTKSGNSYISYDIEHDQKISYALMADAVSIKWLDDDHTWSDYNDSLTIREFDGTNEVGVNSVVPGQGVTLSSNDKYLYSFAKTAAGYQLQRVRMVLP